MSSKTTKTNFTPAKRTSARAKTLGPRIAPVRVTRTRKNAKDALPPVAASIPTPIRKPLWNRNNGLAPTTDKVKKPAALKAYLDVPKYSDERLDVEHEPIKAFLRIRPRSSEEQPTVIPYLSALSETLVQMTDPFTSTSRLRPVSVRSTYAFSKVFPPEVQQREFFMHVALPLIRDVLDGQNGLLFAYGVTNSGKTYTIQGGSQKGEGGLLPRTLDVIFNSVDGLHSDAPFRPVRLAGVEYDAEGLASARSSVAQCDGSRTPFDLPVDADQSVLASVIAEQVESDDRDDTVLKVDRNYEYSIWVSYAEIYNEKVFDLLGISSLDPPSPDAPLPPSNSTLSLPRSHSNIGGFASCANLTALANAQTSSDLNTLLVKRKALALKNDPDGGKYIAGLREVRVRSAEEAKAIVKMGQINRRVFGTLANSASSRSHGIFTLKIMRVHKGCPNDPEAIQTARLSIVDLAGSERANNTHNTGERLKEAGNINKSLMVLGQCMEALRTNQRKLAAAPPGVLNIKLVLVPFRHSKLTELFQDFFVGDGKAVMIVNVNPYDTGFYENSHVMKFSALAKDVSTTAIKKIPSSSIPRLASNTNHRQVTISTGGKAGTRVTETHLDILEEDEEIGDEESEPDDPLVAALFEQVEELRVRLFESEMRCALIESETRDEVMKEMEERMMRMERMFARRLMTELEESQLKTDRKIDLLHQAGLIGAATKQPEKSLDDLEDELGVEMSLVVDSDSDEFEVSYSPGTSSSYLDESPLSGKGQLVKLHSLVEDNIIGPIGLSDTITEDEAGSSGTEESEKIQLQDATTESEITEDSGEDSEWVPDSESTHHASLASLNQGPHFKVAMGIIGKTPVKFETPTSPYLPQSSPEVSTVTKSKGSSRIAAPPASPLEYKTRTKATQRRRINAQERMPPELGEEATTRNDSTIIIPIRRTRKATMTNASEHLEADESPKKKKRTLGKKTIVTEDEIEAVTSQVARVDLHGKQGSVRRLATRGSK